MISVEKHRIVRPGKKPGVVISGDGEELPVPEHWAFLPAGDGPLTKRVKAQGLTWVVEVRRGKRRISQGIWAEEKFITKAQKELSARRDAPGYQLKKVQAVQRREKQQLEYQEDFYSKVLSYLHFHDRYTELANCLARKVTEHATPIGSGTVARTGRLPLEKKAALAVIAWMRHATTDYDTVKVARIKGARRQLRAELAAGSVRLLDSYRRGEDMPLLCPLKQALSQPEQPVPNIRRSGQGAAGRRDTG